MTDHPAELLAGAAIEPAALERLRGRLVAAATQDGLLDVAYTTIDSPIGPLLVATTSKGLVRVAFASEGHDAVLDGLAVQLSPRVLRAPNRLNGTVRQLDEYFAGTRTRFDIDLDWSLSAGFRQVVQRCLPRIAYGQTKTYAQVAQLAGNPKAVRAVGTACATNPLPIVVPCHRVLRADGSLGGYRGGPAVKAQLLDLEAASG